MLDTSRYPRVINFNKFYAGSHTRAKSAYWLRHVMSVRVYQLGSQWKDFRELSNWRLLWKSVEKNQISVKSDKNIGHFIWIPKYSLHCCQRHKIAIKALLIAIRKRNNTKRTHCSVCIVDSDVGMSRILTERTVAAKVTLYQAYFTVVVTWTCLPTPQRYIIQNLHCRAYYKNFSEITKLEQVWSSKSQCHWRPQC